MNCPKEMGLVPTVMEVETELLLVLMTETVLLAKFATYALVPSGVTETPYGFDPTVMVVGETELLLVSITETVLSMKFAT